MLDCADGQGPCAAVGGVSCTCMLWLAMATNICVHAGHTWHSLIRTYEAVDA
jgi:hypothetical protein